MNHCDQPTSTPTIFLAMPRAAALGASEVRNSERGDRGGRERGPHHIGADLARGGSGLGAVDSRDIADDRIHRAAAARRIGRRGRGQNKIGECYGITETDGVAAEAAHQQQRNPPAEAALAVSDREHEGADDQPHRAFGKPAQHPAQRLVGIVFDVTHHAGEGEADQADRAHRHGFQDQACDHRREHREIMPLVGVETRRNRR